MDNQRHSVVLYTAQTNEIVAALQQRGSHCAKLDPIAGKYGEVREVFLRAYKWYVEEAQRIVPKRPEAESAIWAFVDERYVERHPGHTVLVLRVPLDEVIFFRMSDWNKVLNMRYIGESKEDEQAFAGLLERYGVPYEGDVITTPFYPLLKQKVLASWQRLFRYDAEIKAGGGIRYLDTQAGLWYINRDWVVDHLVN